MKTAIQVGKELIASKAVRALSKPESEVLVMLNMLMASGGSLDGVGGQDDLPAPYKIMAARLDWAKVPYTKEAAFYLAACCDRAGTAVLYAAVIAAIADMKGGVPVDLHDCVHTFPMGLPMESELQKAWIGQKREREKPGEPDNWLDMPQAWGLKADEQAQ